ncbi:hypothetical protein [Pelagicoccus mobilis]|uniref:Uncharacterized protein n=1 Tax=Pelagicoccus mobilis TaxID=415221 RepID=A0A934RWB5_9BACT|nr:hypothetical protein [Pelagicoccus mobilis]MBK1877997.1 hypothetical protein [Pelagicoccus mobilis]
METALNSTDHIPTPEVVSPTANWGKPTFKKGLKLRTKLKLRNEFGERSIHQPTEQPTLNRIKADQDELLDAINQIKSTVNTTRRLHAQYFNQEEK